MRDPKRIYKVLYQIYHIWKANPDLRLGQLIGNAFPGDNYYLEDEKLLEGLKRTYKKKS